MKRLCFIAVAAAEIATSGQAVTLDALMRKTAEKNLAIAEARLAVEQATGKRVVLRAVALPTLGVGVVAGDLGGSRAGQASNQPFAFGTGTLVQPLFNVAIPPTRRLGNIGVLIAEQQLNIAMVAELHSARVAFYGAQYNGALADLLSSQQDRLAANARSQRNLYEAGVARRDGALAADLTTREFDAKIAAARHDHQAALLKLSHAINASESPIVDGNVAFVSRQFDVVAAASTALRRRADLQVARLIVQSSTEEVRIAEANYLPAVNAIASGTYIPVSGIRQTGANSPRHSDQFVSSEVQAGVGYTWRIMDAGRFDGEIGRTRAAREVNEIVYRRLTENIPRELGHIKNDLAALDARHNALLKAADLAEQDAITIRDNFSQGRSSQLELRDAENTTLQVQTGLLTVAYQQSVGVAEWDRATGGYLEFSDDAPRTTR